jgi:succinylglutamic semialdehyde dehydrogenase
MTLRQPPRAPRGDLIDGRFVLPAPPDGAIESRSPADLDDTIGTFPWARAHVAAAVAAARRAFAPWRRASPENRADHLRAFARSVKRHRERLEVAIARAIGKPLWEARTEVDAVIAKVDITLGAGLELIQPRVLADIGAVIRYRPLGVAAVIGPFNFPAHLANGHIVPALATGNTVVFKPSEKAPEVGEIMAECFAEAGFPPGVVNVVQGGMEVSQALVGHADVDAVMFTGSTAVGRAILAASAPWPGRMLALEMGGKNAAIVLADADLGWAAREIAFAAYVTAGQRCTATSRVLVERAVADALIEKLAFIAREIRVGPPDAPDTFLGPVINEIAQRRAIEAARRLPGRYDEVVPARVPDVGVRGYYVAPALYRLREGVPPDRGALECEELFAPVLTIEVVDAAEEAVARANDTRYGLAASVYTASCERFEALAPELEVGICNWNRSTVGSSSKLPFGGIKDSGNHRPAGLFSIYYCVDPVAELRIEKPQHSPLPPGFRVPG